MSASGDEFEQVAALNELEEIARFRPVSAHDVGVGGGHDAGALVKGLPEGIRPFL